MIAVNWIAATDVLLQNLGESPHIPQGDKDALAELVLCHDFAALRAATHCGPPPPPVDGRQLFEQYRAMVVAIFTKSKKMAAIDGG